MRAVDVLRKKRDGHSLTSEEISAFVRASTHSEWPDYQVSALLMAIVCRGMNAEETATLTQAMIESGAKLDWSELSSAVVDKHSTGGVGDKTSLILAPLAAACGAVVPMMSGRGLGHTGGTLDKLESIPGFRVNLSLPEMTTVLEKIGCVLIGQTAEIAPADKALYAMRDVTATVESIPLISASIMSKKIAEGIRGLVLDVKCGEGAFMKTREDARALAESLISIGQASQVRTEAAITDMSQPLGRAVGNSLEVIESIETLKGKGPKDLGELSVHLAARMVRLAGLTETLKEAEAKVRGALTSGQGVEKFREIIELQGGDPRVIDDYGLMPSAPERHVVTSERTGIVTAMHAEKVGVASMLLGAGREKVEDLIDPGVGIYLLKKVGETVELGDGIFEIHYRKQEQLEKSLTLLRDAIEIGESVEERVG